METQDSALVGHLTKTGICIDVRGRPWADARQVLSGVLWIPKPGAQRSELPDKYPPHQTCHRRYQKWVRADSEGLDEQHKREWGIEMIAPHKENRKRPATQDGRKLCRYRHGRGIERLFAWIFSFRRTSVRYEVKPKTTSPSFASPASSSCLEIYEMRSESNPTVSIQKS